MDIAVLAGELRNVRVKSSLTQKELGDMIGVTRQLITRIESGTQNVTIETSRINRGNFYNFYKKPFLNPVSVMPFLLY